MKISKLLLLFALLCINCQLFSQDAPKETASYIRPFGIGLHLEQFKIHDLSESLENVASNKIVFTFNPSRSFRLEPEIGFNTDKHTEGPVDFKNRTMNLGLGVFGMTQRNRLNIYGGARFEYSIQQQKQTYSNNDQTANVTVYTLGPALGCEYYLIDQVALGGEFAVKFATLSEDYEVDGHSTENNNDDDKKFLWTDTGLFLRFYF